MWIPWLLKEKSLDDFVDPKRLVHSVTFADAKGLKLEPYPALSGAGDAKAKRD